MNDESRQEYWDECWDTITTITREHHHLLPILLLIIRNPAYNGTSKLYALQAIERIDPELDRSVNSVIQSLDDNDFSVRGQATRLLAQYKGNNLQQVTVALVRVFRTKEIIGVKKDAIVSLIRLIGLKESLVSLVSS